MPTPMNTTDDLWKHVDRTGTCWLWQGWTNPDGYGEFKINYHTYLVHRLSYELANGEIQDGKCVCHACDNPACVNPSHLFLGTQADNIKDRDLKGRTVRGEDIGASKLATDDVVSIRELFSQGRSKRSLAAQFDVSRAAIRHAVNRTTWSHVA